MITKNHKNRKNIITKTKINYSIIPRKKNIRKIDNYSDN